MESSLAQISGGILQFHFALVAKHVLLTTGILPVSNADYAEKNSNVSSFS